VRSLLDADANLLQYSVQLHCRSVVKFCCGRLLLADYMHPMLCFYVCLFINGPCLHLFQVWLL